MLRPRPRRWLVVTLAAVLAGSALAGPAPAAADEHHPCPLDINDYGSAIEWGLACVDYFTGDGDAGGGGSQECVFTPNPWGIPIACPVHETYGWWSNSVACWLQPERPPLPADHPAWEGNDPEDGVIYLLTCPWFEGVDGLPYWEWTFLRYFPASSGLLGQLVERAIAELEITGPDIQMAPDPGGTGLVGLPVWMWTTVTEHTWAPEPLRLSALGWVVVVEASVDRMVWEMGNGVTVVCDQGPGTPYQDHFGAQPSPDCGYDDGYDRPSSGQPDGTFAISATSHWLLDWRFEGTAVSGTQEAVRASETSVRIHELQVVTS